MPIYEFKCRRCGREFEELVRLGETASCPSCHGNELERLVSLPAVSTDKSRRRSFAKAREKAKDVHREKKHAQAEYERNYIKDHS